MAIPSFAYISSGSLSGAANVNFVQGTVRREHVTTNTTGSGSGTSSRTTPGRFEHVLRAAGHWDTGGGTFPLPVGVDSENGPIERFSRVRLRKHQVTKNATAGTDGEGDNVVTKGVITYSGRATGFMKADEDILSNQSTQQISQANISNLKIPLDSSHDITADAVISNIREQLRFSEGGPVMVRFDFVLSGTVTLNGANHPFDATEFSASLNADNGDQWDGTVVYRTMDANIDYDNGTPIEISVEGPFSGCPAVAITAA